MSLNALLASLPSSPDIADRTPLTRKSRASLRGREDARLAGLSASRRARSKCLQEEGRDDGDGDDGDVDDDDDDEHRWLRGMMTVGSENEKGGGGKAAADHGRGGTADEP